MYFHWGCSNTNNISEMPLICYKCFYRYKFVHKPTLQSNITLLIYLNKGPCYLTATWFFTAYVGNLQYVWFGMQLPQLVTLNDRINSCQKRIYMSTQSHTRNTCAAHQLLISYGVKVGLPRFVDVHSFHNKWLLKNLIPSSFCFPCCNENISICDPQSEVHRELLILCTATRQDSSSGVTGYQYSTTVCSHIW